MLPFHVYSPHRWSTFKQPTTPNLHSPLFPLPICYTVPLAFHSVDSIHRRKAHSPLTRWRMVPGYTHATRNTTATNILTQLPLPLNISTTDPPAKQHQRCLSISIYPQHSPIKYLHTCTCNAPRHSRNATPLGGLCPSTSEFGLPNMCAFVASLPVRHYKWHRPARCLTYQLVSLIGEPILHGIHEPNRGGKMGEASAVHQLMETMKQKVTHASNSGARGSAATSSTHPLLTKPHVLCPSSFARLW